MSISYRHTALGTVEITAVCTRCGKEQPKFTIDDDQLNELRLNRRNIQDILPNLSPGQRELFQTGICDPCWTQIFENGDK